MTDNILRRVQPSFDPQVIVLTHFVGTPEPPDVDLMISAGLPIRSGPVVSALLVVLVGLLLPDGVAAQSDSRPGLGEDGLVGGEIHLSPGVGMIRGTAMATMRASAALRVSPWLLVGGEAVIPLSDVRTTDPTTPDRSELRLRYGGVRLGLRRPHLGDADPWTLSFLVGTGTARVRSSLLATDLGTDNFLVIEPSFERRFGAAGPVLMGGAVAYRMPIGAQPLPGLRPDQLRGLSMSISLGLRRNP